jgi:predicted nucleic acid-binding protein
VTLAHIPDGSRVFADANVLVYGFMQAEPFVRESTQLLARSARREIELLTAAHTAAEVVHRVMMIEARATLGLSSGNTLNHLKRHPQAVKQLTEYKQVPGKFTQARINILPVTYREIHNSEQFRDIYGLLTNDSIILAVMSHYKLMDLATNDRDFQRVPGIRLWTPVD